MRTRMSLFAVLGLAVASVACGDNTTTSETTTPPSTTSATTTTISTAELEAKLLAVGDLPAGWSLGEPVNEQDFADAKQIPCQDQAINPTIAARLTPVAGIQFQPASGTSSHLIEFVTVGEAQRLSSDFQVLIDAMRACESSLTTAPATTTLTVAELTIPELGDQRVAFLMKDLEVPTKVWYVRDAAVRVGGVIVEVGLTEILASKDATPTTTDAEFVAIVQAAVDHFNG